MPNKKILFLEKHSVNVLHSFILKPGSFLCSPTTDSYLDYSLIHTEPRVLNVAEGRPAKAQFKVVYNPLQSSLKNPEFEKDFSLTLWLSLSKNVTYPM